MQLLSFLHNNSQVIVSALVLSTVSFASQAEYTDPIDLPSVHAERAIHSLQIDVAVTDDRVISVGERGIILYSNDKGINWRQAEVPTSAHLNSVFFHNEAQGWAVGEDQVIVKTNDGGLSWSYQYDARDSELKGPLLDLLFQNELSGYAVGVYNTFKHTPDGGQTWYDLSHRVENPDEWHLFAIANSESGAIYITSEAGLVFSSQDGGKHFRPLETGHDGSLHALLVRGKEKGKDVILALGVGGTLLFSQDSGANWDSLKTGTNAGLSGGAWISHETALITTSDGSLLKVDLKERRVNPTQVDLGFPLSSVARIDANHVVVAGLAGVHMLSELDSDGGSRGE